MSSVKPSSQSRVAHDSGHRFDVETPDDEKLKYPKSIFFIVSNEFCERFSYYGLRTILSLYLRSKLGYSDDTSTVIYHIFAMFVYFFPLFGAMLADSVLGKFRTILYLSIVYAIGQIVLSASTVPTFGLPIREFSLGGLFLIALGTGGIKPCVAAFGGDQFILPQQEKYLVTFFSVFYFAINSGSLLSTFITPELRNGVKCFGEQDCYSLAFIVPAILMILSIVIFVVGKPMYRMKKPEGNVVLSVFKCISHALYNKTTRKKGDGRDHWLDHADDKYDGKLIGDIKAALQVLKLFVPLPFFWALYDQQGSRWTFQATRMDGEIGSFLLKADQMQVVNPLLILLFIPVFETCLYPVFAKIKLIDTPLKKLTTGGFLAALAFIASAIVELQLENTYPILPSDGIAQLRIFNPRNCSLPVTIADYPAFTLEPYGMWQNLEIPVDKNGSKLLSYSANFSACGNYQLPSSGKLEVLEKESMSYVIQPSNNEFYKYIDANNKTKSGNPAVRILLYNNIKSEPIIVQILEKNQKAYEFKKMENKIANSEIAELAPGTYEVKVNGKILPNNIKIKLGGVYTVMIDLSNNEATSKMLMITEANSIHILWLIPQYIIMTMAEVMFSVTGLAFAFTQAPVSMKSLLQAGWLMTVAFGNLIVVIVAEAKFFDRQVNEFLLFAGLMTIDMIVFGVIAFFYRYTEVSDEFEEEEEEAARENDNRNMPMESRNTRRRAID